jgi:hypothetical protein
MVFSRLDVPRSVKDTTYRGPIPAPIVLTKVAPLWGDSLRAGDLATPYEIWTLDSALVSGEAISNEGVGGETSAQIAARVVAGGATKLAGHNGLEMGRNDVAGTIGTTGVVADVMANFATSVAAVTGKYHVTPPPPASSEPAGDAPWAQCKSIHRKLVALYPTKTLDWTYLLQRSANPVGQDRTDVSKDFTPQSTRILPDFSVDLLHFGRKGNSVIAYQCDIPWLAACEGGTPYAMPYQEVHVVGAAAATARGANGLIATARFEGTPDSCALIGPNPIGAVIASDGQITNATTNGLTAPYYDFYFTGTKAGAISNTGLLRVFVGASDNSCSDTLFDGRCFMSMPDAPSGVSAQKGSGICAFSTASGTDGTSMFLLGNENLGKFTIERTTGNRLRIIGKNAANTTVVSIQTGSSGAGLITSTSGIVWVFFSWDASPGTPLSQVYVNETTSKSVATLTQGETVAFDFRLVVAAQTQSNANPFKGTFRLPPMLFNDYIDWSVQARRDEAYVSATKAAVVLGDTGAINGIVPFLWMPGNAADRAWGYNRGTGGDFVTALLPGTTLA